jgi:hypothetical protein
MLGMIFAGAILAAGAPAAAPEAAKPPTAMAAAKPAGDPDKIICRSTQLPGSRLMTRTCLSAAVWRERELEDRKDLNGSQRGPQVMPPR